MTPSTAHSTLLIAAGLCLLALGGCSAAPQEPAENGKAALPGNGPAADAEQAPSAATPGTRPALSAEDLQIIAGLVVDLQSDQASMRFVAISELEKRTGQRLGYDYFAKPEERDAAVKRWRQWLAERMAATR